MPISEQCTCRTDVACLTLRCKAIRGRIFGVGAKNLFAICARASPGTNLILRAMRRMVIHYCLLTAQPSHVARSIVLSPCQFLVLSSDWLTSLIKDVACWSSLDAEGAKLTCYLTLLRYNHILRSRVTGDAPHIILIPERYWLPVTCHGQVVAWKRC